MTREDRSKNRALALLKQEARAEAAKLLAAQMTVVDHLRSEQVPRGNTPEYISYVRKVVEAAASKQVLNAQVHALVDMSAARFGQHVHSVFKGKSPYQGPNSGRPTWQTK